MVAGIVGSLLLFSCARQEKNSAEAKPRKPETIEQLEQMDRGTSRAVATGDPEIVEVVLTLWRDTLKGFLTEDTFPPDRVRRCIALTCGRLALLQERAGNPSGSAERMSEAMQYVQGFADIDTEAELKQEILSLVKQASRGAQQPAAQLQSEGAPSD